MTDGASVRAHLRRAVALVAMSALPVCAACADTPRDASASDQRAMSAAPAVGTVTCVVAKLADGDSFTCADGRKLRLLLMDAPELHQKPWGLMAKRQLETLAAPGTSLRLELDKSPTDRYGRTLAYAWADSVMINEWMVSHGWAVVLAYENVRHLDRLQRAERAAQDGKKGFWQSWAFRCRPVDYRAHRCGDAPTPQKRKSRRS